jgi:4-diphosphocytidyl-2-C-methyl-D-erythritol kinase
LDASRRAEATSEPAPAKINLALQILGRREDGYHDIDSLVVFADIGDRVAASATNDGPTLAVEGPFAADLLATTSVGGNLVLRAAEAIAGAVGKTPSGLALQLTKNLPIGAGIGGGSADAAATLRLLDRYWQLRLPPEQLEGLALELGADVPMCLRSGALRASGKGEKLADVGGLPPLPMVLVFPSAIVDTGAVFARRTGAFDPPLPELPTRFGGVSNVAGWLGQTRNGLEQAGRSEAPVIDEVLRLLAASEDCLLARMSGSGSCCFGLYPTRAVAERAASSLQAEHADWWVEATTAS